MDIYVGNLPYTATDPDLQELFEQHGKVTSARVILDRMSGRSKGFGFVEMADNDQAKAAMKALDGKDVDGRNLTVNEARPREERSGGGFGGGGGRPGGGFGGGRRY